MGKASRIRKERKDAESVSHLTRAQRKAMRKEIDNQCAEQTNKFFRNEAAVILYALHEIFGFGKVRLWRFYSHYYKCHQDLCKWYEMSAEEDGYDVAAYLSKLQLEKIGVNYDEWEDRLGKLMKEENENRSN